MGLWALICFTLAVCYMPRPHLSSPQAGTHLEAVGQELALCHLRWYAALVIVAVQEDDRRPAAYILHDQQAALVSMPSLGLVEETNA